MPPHALDTTFNRDPETAKTEQFKSSVSTTNGIQSPYPGVTEVVNKDNKALAICLSVLTVLGRIFIGATVGISYAFAFRSGVSMTATNLHIVLCVTGFHLLMAEAILCLAEEGGWTKKINLMEKRRVHWILQILGSTLAIVGCFIKIVDKEIHWNTSHGQFALVALIFTSVSLVNGLASLYAYELRRLLPGSISKITHVCFGIVAFVSSSISLCYGFDKNSFRTWVQFEPLAETVISFTVIFTVIVIIAPSLTFYSKSRVLLKR